MKAFSGILALLAALVFVPWAESFQGRPVTLVAPPVSADRPYHERSHPNLASAKKPSMLSSRPSLSSSSSLGVLLLAEATDASTLGFLQNRDVWVFIAGIFPFAWATVEFWRRIAFGEQFGTGSDSVVIGMEDSPADSRGRRVLGKDALVLAYILFALAFGTIGIVLYSVITSGTPPEMLPSSQEMVVSVLDTNF